MHNDAQTSAIVEDVVDPYDIPVLDLAEAEQRVSRSFTSSSWRPPLVCGTHLREEIALQRAASYAASSSGKRTRSTAIMFSAPKTWFAPSPKSQSFIF